MVGQPRARLPDARVKAEIADELLGLVETPRLADRRRDGQRHDHVDARDGHQPLDPVVRQSRASKIALDDLEVLAEPIELAQMTSDGKSFVLRQDLMKKPCPSARPAQIRVRTGGIRWLCRIDWMIFFNRDRCRTI